MTVKELNLKELKNINYKAFQELRNTIIMESEKAVISFDQWAYENGCYYYNVREKKENTTYYRSFSTSNLVTALKRYRKYNE